MIRIMIADTDRQWAQILTEAAAFIYNKEMEIIAVCDKSRDIFWTVNRLRPDVLLIDLTLPGGDSSKVIRRVRSLGSASPTVIALSTQISNRAVRDAMDSGAAYYLMKPARPEVVLQRAQEFVRQWRPEIEPSLPRPDIGSVLRDYGFPYSLRGTEFIRCALAEMLHIDEELDVRSLCKRLTERYALKGRAAESGMRMAMRAVWKKGAFSDIDGKAGDQPPPLCACLEHIRDTIRREAAK